MTPTEIKILRANRGLTQNQLAAELGVSPRTVAGWEQGRCVPNSAAMRGIKRLANGAELESPQWTIRNDFHNTETTVDSLEIPAKKARRIARLLCGVGDCMCGGVLGQRGPDAITDRNGRHYWADERQDGSVVLRLEDP